MDDVSVGSSELTNRFENMNQEDEEADELNDGERTPQTTEQMEVQGE
jgi:hypothetical protein